MIAFAGGSYWGWCSERKLGGSGSFGNGRPVVPGQDRKSRIRRRSSSLRPPRWNYSEHRLHIGRPEDGGQIGRVEDAVWLASP
ncbi:MAG: hypothetical protein R3C28_23015 [Pirellulaceae bacterium]